MNISEEDISRIVSEVIAGASAATTPQPAAQPASTAPVGKTARAAVLVEPRKLEIKEFPIREIGPDEILLKVEACGVCGTDVHCYKSDPFGLTPNVLGHEGTGEVVQLGANVKMDSVGKAIKVGDKLVTSLLETSPDCLVAKYNPAKSNLSDDLKVYGLLLDEPDNHLNGYFAEYMIIRPGSSFFVVNDMSVELRCLIEPAAVVCHALERARSCGNNRLNFRSRVVVQGCGPIGLLMIAVLRTAGVNNIIALDGNPSRLETARRMGADELINYKEYSGIDEIAEKIQSLTKGLGAHWGFQVTGVPVAHANLYKLIRRGGGICEVGHFVDGGECAINPHRDICAKEISLVGSWVYNSFEYPSAYHFLQRAERIGLPVSTLVTHKFPLDQIDEAFQVNLRQEGIKVVVESKMSGE
ncbi:MULTISPECIES: zinc-binding dehydrogenase [unclassified Lentimonas]|uniref:zinc-dependent alcohol dehydrogenase n=1 Tax=unclassified Lentimonas TaxID=2630993 RepID=UPI001324ECC9|nr:MULTISPECIES: zinc-binding dehydrogenase [unclassified Lentimonas]CAA6679149.1 Threonine dehydrogenase and related Zn-dependent dehydrogenases [Lentimonas sp. CC4]CAA6684107.1 Threonine dehydrogenase and related Zn-dependent dehydrogenases [Lentimonas sp. CC6]CAA6694425.1 Threonine dehydrogenase and related Zn-dependent dehydrogenases [Lentimonas sp. CC19]CAA6697065.1 Threonine dehydrogenase and related Zn-dependent dehydrogenases [Lentimonas sp. CC10]CAA7069521.1 Threonine dehydrogenase an